jgi:hypothetical protein
MKPLTPVCGGGGGITFLPSFNPSLTPSAFLPSLKLVSLDDFSDSEGEDEVEDCVEFELKVEVDVVLDIFADEVEVEDDEGNLNLDLDVGRARWGRGIYFSYGSLLFNRSKRKRKRVMLYVTCNF